MMRTVRSAVFGLAAAGAVASAVAASLLVSDASLNRVYFGTDTRVQALLVGAAASALLVRDWSSLARYGHADPVAVGALAGAATAGRRAGGAGAAAHYATGSVREFRGGLLIVVAVAAVLVVAPVALHQCGLVARGLACPPLVWLGADLLRHLPVALADLPGAQR